MRMTPRLFRRRLRLLARTAVHWLSAPIRAAASFLILF